MSSSDTITSALSSATRRRPLSRWPAHAFDRLDVHSPVRKFHKGVRAVALGGTGSCVSRTLVGGDMRNTRRRFVPIIVSAVLALPALVAAQEPVTITGKVASDAAQPLGQVEVAIP